MYVFGYTHIKSVFSVLVKMRLEITGLFNYFQNKMKKMLYNILKCTKVHNGRSPLG